MTEKNRKKVYLCVPEDDVEFASKMIAAVYAEGHIPMEPKLTFEFRHAQDTLAGRRDLIDECDEVRVLGSTWTEAMWEDIRYAQLMGIPVLTDQEKVPRTKRKQEPTR